MPQHIAVLLLKVMLIQCIYSYWHKLQNDLKPPGKNTEFLSGLQEDWEGLGETVGCSG